MLRLAFRFNDRRLFARLVCLIQGGDTAHCEVVLGESSGAAGGYRCASASWLDGGVRFKVLALPAEKWRVYELADPSGLQSSAAHGWFMRHHGDRYDWLGLLGFVVRRLKGFQRRWFCSEACAAALGLGDPYRFDPATLEAVAQRVGQRIQ